VRPRLARSNPGKTNYPVRQFHKCIVDVRELIGSGLNGLNPGGRRPRSGNILPLQHNVREQQRERDAHPHDSLDDGLA